MGDSSNPSKKPRLDIFEEANDAWDLAGNDDLWGKDELTAEEFDLLEIQASQAIAGNENILNVEQSRPKTSSNVISYCQDESTKLEQLKQEQYALEGKNKALTERLEKTMKELNDERSNREQVIEQKLADSKLKEANLLRQIDQLQTSLQFMEHEVISERGKIYNLEHQLKEVTKEIPAHRNSFMPTKSLRLSTAKRSPRSLQHWSSFDSSDKVRTAESGIQTEISRCRRFPLSLQGPRGEPKENDALCKLLSSRIANSFSKSCFPASSSEGNMNNMSQIFRRARDSSTMSITMLRCGEELENVWQPYENALQEFINHLKIKQSPSELERKQASVFVVKGTSHFDLRQQSGVVDCLKDLARLLFHQCPKKTSKNLDDRSEKKDYLEVYNTNSLSLVGGDVEMGVEQKQRHCLAELLVTLANPATYPHGYKRTSEIEWALAALVAWSAHFKESLESRIQDLPLHSLISMKHGMECAYMAVKLVVQLIGMQSLKRAFLCNHDSSCILCSIGNLCRSIHDSPGNQSSLIMNVIENCLSGVLMYYGFGTMKDDSRPCSSKVVQGVIIMLLKHLLISKRLNLPCHVTVIKKGVILLLFLATHLPNFRDSRIPVEESYVALICSLSQLCKENAELKNLRSKIRFLWDFQDDSSEFESEETHSLQSH